ncbi:MAG: LamG-like jellyroll fold domain-containing protein [Bacteroidota bacterium]
MKTFHNTFKRPLAWIIMLLLLLFRPASIHAQDRDGSIDLTASSGRSILINHDGRGKGLGIEGSAFTVEAWVHLESGQSDFNLIRFRNGNARFSLKYRGDANKSSDPWQVELKDVSGVGEGKWGLNYNKNGSTGPDFTGSWHHVAFTSNGGSGIRLYVDGVWLISYSLQDSKGNALTSIFPVQGDGDNNCHIGNESYVSKDHGKFYVGEIRVWKTQLSSGEISQYYNEEVNSSHPEWSNLVRYYTGHESSGSESSRTFRDRSPVDRYDATVSNSDVTVSLDYTPIVKPGDFDNNTITTDFDASNCRWSYIELDWEDFQSASSYQIRTAPSYEVKRSSDGTVVYSGNDNTYQDKGVTYGDATTYEMRTFWYINDVKIYSDNSIYSDKGSVPSRFDAPSGFTASSDKCDVTIDLSWDGMSPSPPEWTIIRGENSGLGVGLTVIAESIPGSDTRYKDNTVNPEKNYYYKIFASGYDDNGCEVVSSLSSVAGGFASEAPSAPTNLSVVVDDDNNELDISWSNSPDSYADGFILRREKEDGSDPVEIVFNNTNTTTYSDSDIQICQTYRYKIAATNECATDGVYSNETQIGLLGKDIEDVLESVTASKGYYSDQILIEWEINGSLSQVDRFRVERTVAGQDNYNLIGVVDNNLFFNDESATSGVFYNYRITGETTCEGTEAFTNELVDMGFRQPFGIANGHIEYEGGNAVKDVTVNFERQDGQTIGNSLKFDGNGDYVAIDSFHYEGTAYDELTIEMWFQTTTSDYQILASSDASEYWRLAIGSGQVQLNIQNTSTITSTESYNDGQWHHVAAVFDHGKLELYVDGELVEDENASSSVFGTGNKRYLFLGVGSEASEPNGTTGPTDYFNGYLDEFRIWSVARTEEQIVENYNRLISNEQTGLEVYYRFDEGVGSQVFDASKTGDNYNHKDGTLIGGVSFSDEIPDADQLGIRAITDEYGDYTADYIPYNGSGDVFRVTPAFGQHEFSPSSKSVFLGDGAAVQNSVDFTDISSFTVSGKVTYENSEVPVEGVAIYIDGDQALGVDNQPVRTDNDGNYTIDVPIGYHYLSAVKEGHTFSEGYFPALTAFGDIQTFEFTQDLTVNFTDDTKVIVAGRMVGGLVESGKVLGFDLSTNNIGVADLQFKLQKENYDLDIADDSTYNVLFVTTDPYSGEYEISMIPEKWIITKAGNDSYFVDAEEIPVLDLGNSLTSKTDVHTVYDDDGEVVSEATYDYHHNLSFTIRAQPVISVYESGTEDEFDGEESVTFADQESGEEIEWMLGANNPFDYPVLQMGKTYTLDVRLNERYENPTHPDGALVDDVAVEEAEVTVINLISWDEATATGKTDEEGLFSFEFVPGGPGLSENGTESYTKTMEIYVSTETDNVTWNNGTPFRAYILGAQPIEGTDFVTYGPEIPEIVLHDPPGSNSYAFIEKGSSFTADKSWSYGLNTTSNLDRVVYSGLKFGVGGGVVGPLLETEITNTSEQGIEIVKESNHEGGFRETFTFTERIETSSDPEDVGTAADLYIGKGNNVFMSKSKNFKPMKKSFAVDNGLDYVDFAGATDDDYVLGFMDGVVIDGSGLETYFIYSHRQLVEEIIPSLMALRDNVLINSPNYTSNYPLDSRYWGLDNDSDVFTEEGITGEFPSYTIDLDAVSTYDIQDSVAFLNQQISVWLSVITLQESKKAAAETIQNVSFDGTSGRYESSITQTINSDYQYKKINNWKAYMNSEFGVVSQGKGFEIHSDFDLGIDLETTLSRSVTNEVTFGYVLDEDNEGDYYSVDVKTLQGISVYNANEFARYLPESESWVNSQMDGYKLAGGIGGGKMLVDKGLHWLVSRANLKLNARYNAYVSVPLFAVDLGLHMIDMANMLAFRENVHKKVNENNEFEITDFAISSPVFAVRGGATRCPYEGEEYTSFHIDTLTNQPVLLHTATLQREVPVIKATPAIQKDIPEDETASFTLQLQNESSSESSMWYSLRMYEGSNPDGAVLLIDGKDPEQDYLVPYGETIEKTLTIAKGQADVFAYDSIGLILSSTCQFDPTSSQADIADTVYVSVEFKPECSGVDLTSFNDNWVLNYEDGNTIQVTMEDFNATHSTLEKISFQYKTLSGDPITGASFFMDDTSTEYQEFSGPKGKIEGSSLSFAWDIEDLTDRYYQVRAVAYCSDGSFTASDYLTGIIDRTTPIVFGTPAPVDGIYEAGDDINIRFSETLESALVRDHNIVLKSVLNGADVSHATSVQFDGQDDAMTIPSVSFNNKSFTIEYWAQAEVESPASEVTLLNHGTGSNLVSVSQTGTDLTFAVGQHSLTVDLSTGVFSAVYPWDSWHHWAFSYDNEAGSLSIYMDDQVVGLKNGISFNPAWSGDLVVANDSWQGKMHELRIWEDERSYGEVIANMSATLGGSEAGLYGYWPMDEGVGTLAQDHTSGRNGTVAANWSLEPGGVSWEFTGTNYLTVDSRNIAIDEETDLTIELWVKGNGNSATQTLFSNGRGDGTDAITDPHSVITMEARTDGTVHVLSNGYDFQATDTDVMDGDWHHLAFVLDRSSTARMYVDGALQNQTSADHFSALYGAKLILGARTFNSGNTDLNNGIFPITYDNYFQGHMDEVRIWKTVKSQLLVETYMHTKLEGDETGLLSYLAFETYEEVQGAYLMEHSLADLVNNEDLSEVDDAEGSDAVDRYSDQKPAVKDVRGLQEIPFEYVVNDDEVIITPNVDLYRIEGQILEISIQNVQDLNGNRQLSPVTWTAFVQQNQVKWDEASLSPTKHVDEAMTITTTFTNSSGAAYAYTLENLPNWLSTNQASGVINPKETIEVDFEVNEALNIGYYDQGINLSTDLGFDEKLTIDLRVFGDEPNWTLDESEFEYSMSVFGQVIIDGVVSTDGYDQVAVFAGDELRGVGSPTYISGVDAYQVFLTIYSNQVNGEDLDFRIYDASTGNVHENVTPNLTFEVNDVQGSVVDPVAIEADNRISMEIALNEGWTWISFNLDDANLGSVDATLSGIGTTGDVVKNQSAFDVLSGGLWFGTLTSGGGFNAGDMYKVKLAKAATLKIKGTPTDVNSTPIAIHAGWNYLGFVPQEQMTLDEALVSTDPTVGDVVKSSNRFAMYAGTSLGWVGSLSSLEPGAGYMLYATDAGTLTYPERASLSGARVAPSTDYDDILNVVANEKGHTMSVVASIEGLGSTALNMEEYLLVAYAEDQVVGYAAATSLTETERFFLSVATEEDAALSFKLYDVQSGTLTDLQGSVYYGADKVTGTIDEPVSLVLNTVLGIADDYRVQVYPNPFKDYLEIDVQTNEALVTITLIDMAGKVLFSQDVLNRSNGVNLQLSDEIRGLKEGVYQLQLLYGNERKVIKLKK